MNHQRFATPGVSPLFRIYIWQKSSFLILLVKIAKCFFGSSIRTVRSREHYSSLTPHQKDFTSTNQKLVQSPCNYYYVHFNVSGAILRALQSKFQSGLSKFLNSNTRHRFMNLEIVSNVTFSNHSNINSNRSFRSNHTKNGPYYSVSLYVQSKHSNQCAQFWSLRQFSVNYINIRKHQWKCRAYE